MKMTNSISRIACVAITTLAFASCMEKDLYQPKSEENPSLINYATTQDVQFKMAYNISKGYAAGFDVYAENPIASAEDGNIVLRTDIQPIAAGIAESGLFDMTKRIPGYVKELYALSNDLFAPTLMYAKIENGTANFKNEIIDTTPPLVAEMTTRSTKSVSLDFIPAMDDQFTPASEGNANVPAEVLTAINKTFPGGKALPENLKQEATMEIKEKAELWIAPLITGCSITNTVGYFCYDGPKSDLAGKSITDLDEKMIVVFPFASLSDNALLQGKVNANIKRGDKFRLQYYDKNKGALVNEFPKGTTIVWFLWSGAFNKETKKWGNGNHKLYSNWDWNTAEQDPTMKPHTAYYSVKHNNTDYFCFGFEDQINKYNDKDFNDLVFMMEANPSTAITPPTVTIDGGGNPITTQTEERKGILAFEDNWPAEGDYDMNDVVTKYKSTTTYAKETNKPTYVSKVEDVFTLIHNGATFHNSFSIKYDISPSAVESVSVSPANGTSSSYRADGNGFIIDLCPDVTNILSSFKSGSFAYNITINFKAGNLPGDENYQLKLAAPYNPYISPKAGTEVHLPMYAPTAGADQTLFGTLSDHSQPGSNIYYVGKEGSAYPFAIHLSGVENFTIPTEQEPIDKAYPKYNNWVKSTATPKADADWYIK